MLICQPCKNYFSYCKCSESCTNWIYNFGTTVKIILDLCLLIGKETFPVHFLAVWSKFCRIPIIFLNRSAKLDFFSINASIFWKALWCDISRGVYRGSKWLLAENRKSKSRWTLMTLHDFFNRINLLFDYAVDCVGFWNSPSDFWNTISQTRRKNLDKNDSKYFDCQSQLQTSILLRHNLD